MNESVGALRTVIFAGGGSGGHLAPGLAVAEALSASSAPFFLRPLFLCSERSVDREMLTNAGVEFAALPARPLSLRVTALPRQISSFVRAARSSRDHLDRSRACVVLALGGFVSVPVAWAARRAGVPVLLLNLDAVAGRANRIVARWASTVISAVPARGLPRQASEVVGMPVRRAALAPAPASDCRRTLELDPDRPTLLVTGASQGSTSLNETVPGIVASAAAIFRGWQILHLCGALDATAVELIGRRYSDAGISARVIPFLHDIGLAWGSATLAVSRAGASSVGEAAANRVPTIFVPFPHHRDLHQRLNAQDLVTRGLAFLARDPMLRDGTDPVLTDVLTTLAGNEVALATAKSSFPTTAADAPARRIAALLERIARR